MNEGKSMSFWEALWYVNSIGFIKRTDKIS